jgi:class 3 adenylate cyclase/tetratricopeptide (TPR) repeat protein
MAVMTCALCGTQNRPTAKFCRRCGSPLCRVCPNGHPVEPDATFCDECGAGVESPLRPAAAAAPSSERRLVTVLFTDLVGFTSLSEAQDPDEVRDFLSRYFDTCRTLITRYGGTVEKFIGDAVMAVWGTPVAQEDDAERAVRAALDLVQAVAELGKEVGWPDLKARAGVLTGEAAVTLGATGEGMVAGDLVNTASRIQAAAPPGAVYVGERTRRTTDAAVVYEDAGSHELKGKAEPIPLWRALRVVAMVGGGGRSHGLEAPFVGRDAELRTVKELFHQSAEGRKAHMVSVIGVAGIGKSRLSWEFWKYIDGLREIIRWHRGRCLAYGEGVTYWALAEMVRSRAEIVEGEDPASARSKLRQAIEEFVPDVEERSWMEARLAHLLALEERQARDPEDLFGAWRRFFERIAEREPVVMIFEDLQWADPSLLDFIEYLLNWSRGFPIFVMSLARPEISDRFPSWAAARRGVSTMYLEPLRREDMQQLLDGLVPGLPDPVRETILDRAEGVPLYAIETVRMLLDRGLLREEESAYRVAGPIEDLAVPESLHALIAARLDGLPPEERALLQDGSVIGKTFSAGALAAVSGRDEASLESNLASLVRKEVLGVQADPRSPERGQYAFLQDLVRRVAYETLSRRDRKARHLAMAAFFERQWAGEEQEIAEVLASHYLEAHRAAPDAPDAAGIKAHARDALVRAGTRSESLAARRAALSYFEQANELTDEPVVKADLLTRAANMSMDAGLLDRGRALYDRAIDITKKLGDEVGEARIEIRRAFMATADGKLEESLERLIRAHEILSKYSPGPELAEAAAEISRIAYFMGRTDQALEFVERAIPVAEELFLPETLSMALNTKSLILRTKGRPQEGMALLRHALRLALEYEATGAAMRAYNNLSSTLDNQSAFPEMENLNEQGLALARKVGHQGWEAKFLSARVPLLVVLGRWDEAIRADEEAAQVPDASALAAMAMERNILCLVHAVRGSFDLAEQYLFRDVLEASDDVQAVGTLGLGEGWVRFYSGRYEESIAAAGRSIATREGTGQVGAVEVSYALSADAALEMGDVDRASEFLKEMGTIPRGQRSPFFRAEIARLKARLAALGGDSATAQARFEEAVAGLRPLGMRFHMAEALAQYGQWLEGEGRMEEAAPMLKEAREIFEDLHATWWLGRLDQAVPARSAAR